MKEIAKDRSRISVTEVIKYMWLTDCNNGFSNNHAYCQISVAAP